MSARSRSDVWLRGVALAGITISMVAEWRWMRRRSPLPGDDREVDTSTSLPSAQPEQDRPATIGYEARDTIASLSMMVGMLVTSQLVWGPFNDRWASWWYRHRITQLGTLGLRSAHGPTRRGLRAATWVGAILLWDFLYYWEHRWMHQVRLLWAHHVSHHSSERYNLSTALRQPWSNILTQWMFTPMMIVGFSPTMTRRVGEWNLVYQYWIHTELIDKLPAPAERVLNTASHHRVHHGVNPEYLDRNYGGILIVWDRLFGTFAPEERTPTYGLTKNVDSFNPLAIAVHEFVAMARDVTSARRWSDRLRFVFGRPGWSPNHETPTGLPTN